MFATTDSTSAVKQKTVTFGGLMKIHRNPNLNIYITRILPPFVGMTAARKWLQTSGRVLLVALRGTPIEYLPHLVGELDRT